MPIVGGVSDSPIRAGICTAFRKERIFRAIKANSLEMATRWSGHSGAAIIDVLAATDLKLGCRASLANELGSRGRHVVSAASGQPVPVWLW